MGAMGVMGMMSKRTEGQQHCCWESLRDYSLVKLKLQPSQTELLFRSVDDCFLPCGRLDHADGWAMRDGWTRLPAGAIDKRNKEKPSEKKKIKKKNIRKRKGGGGRLLHLFRKILPFLIYNPWAGTCWSFLPLRSKIWSGRSSSVLLSSSFSAILYMWVV